MCPSSPMTWANILHRVLTVSYTHLIGYYRLSMEDDSEGESNSIINQRKLVKDYISHIPELAAKMCIRDRGQNFFLLHRKNYLISIEWKSSRRILC